MEAPVFIVRANYDFWYELGKADDQLEPGEVPELNPDGVLFYVAFKRPDKDSFWPDSAGYATIEEAKTHAEGRVPGDIKWVGV